MRRENKLMEKDTAPGIGKLVRIEHHQIGGDWSPIVLHWHDYCELEVVTSGAGIHTLNNQDIPISRGSTFICMLDDFHTLTNDGNITKLINLKFPESIIQPDILKRLYSAANQRYCLFNEKKLSRVLETISFLEEIQTQSHHDEELQRTLIESLLNQILILLILQNPEATNKTTDDKYVYRIQKATEYIHRHFKENISEDDVAQQINLSANYFSSEFKKKTGTSFAVYIKNLRLNYARNLIETKRVAKISEIASMSGFYSKSYFIKSFRQKFGTTPKEMMLSKDTETNAINKEDT